MRFLTKSRFALALECPTKLYYTGKPGYANRKNEDDFLQALAEGGFQVGALARVMYPGGCLIERSADNAQMVARTRELLQQDDVTLYEAALAADGLLVLVDVLRKKGNCVELIEVKAKSFDPAEDGDFRKARGQGFDSKFLPYLQDIAFQRHVAGLAYPHFEFSCHLLMADKSRRASVDGLNQRFRVRRRGQSAEVLVKPGTDAQTIGAPILSAVDVTAQVGEILVGNLRVHDALLPFPQAVTELAAAYREDRPIGPAVGQACGSCEFRTVEPPVHGQPHSGFHECWKSAFGWTNADFAGGTVLDLWNFRGKEELIGKGVLKLSQVGPDDLKIDEREDGLSRGERQWMQVSGQWDGGGPFFLDRQALAVEMRKWEFPLHFIDFETSKAALPFTRDRAPYEVVAFQFSHHVLQENGRIEHRTQYLNTEPGAFPNYNFLRALQAALQSTTGTIFRWASHENTVLNELREQLLADPQPPSDRDALVAFIESITSRKSGKRGEEIVGARCMADLCRLAEKLFFHPSTRGSSSLKKVLPAVMSSSDFLREFYAQPVYGGAGGIPSLNFTEPMTWWRQESGRVLDPYALLPPMFEDIPAGELQKFDVGDQEGIREGGAAMAAYARLQFEDLPGAARERIENALLRYCELDTLAMVMVVQSWRAWM